MSDESEWNEVQVWQAGDWLAPALLWRDELREHAAE